ncbi:MAG: SUMF1/EgtB/PvdO family nonheme iron enzyme [Pikeienuella sp.]
MPRTDTLVACSIARFGGLLATTLMIVGASAAPAQNRPPACAFDDPARAVALGREEAAVCVPLDRENARPERLVLPMPCGHVMHFKRIDVPVEHILDHEPARFGDPNAASGSAAQAAVVAPWYDVLSGAFSVRDAAGEVTDRAYYLAQYEVTIPQWRLFETGVFAAGPAAYDPASPACADHLAWMAAASPRDGYGRADMVLPQTGLSWFDAVAFSRAYTNWLLQIDKILVEQGDRPVLPWQDGSSGFIRLPTEAEWEFAARDGQIGPDAQNRRLHLVNRDGVETVPALGAIAQTEGWGGHAVSGVGRLEPNLHGIHDMLGNAEEFALEPFRATRPDGLHGQRGGAVLRGGSPATPDSHIALGYRRESALFGPDGEVKEPQGGARMAVSAPFFVYGARADAPFAFDQLSNTALDDALAVSRERLTGRVEGVSDFEDLVARIRENPVANPDAQRLLEAGLALLERSSAESATAAREALRQRLISGAALSASIFRTGANVFDAWTRFGQISEKILANPNFAGAKREDAIARIEAARAQLELREREIEEIYATYLENLAALAIEPDAKLLARVEEEVAERFAAPELAQLAKAYQMQASHLAEWRQRGARDEDMSVRWLYEIDEYRDRRDVQREN